MRRSMFLLAFLVVIGLVAYTIPVCAAPPIVQTETVHTFFNPPGPPEVDVVDTEGRLTRHGNRVNLKIQTRELSPHETYTVWAVIFNDPSVCSAPCGLNDLGLPGTSVFWATGGVADANGEITFVAHIVEGELPDGEQQIIVLGDGLGLTNVTGAEIHFVIRGHGPIIPGSLVAQTTMVNGGCNPDCEDVQAVAFLPVSPAPGQVKQLAVTWSKLRKGTE